MMITISHRTCDFTARRIGVVSVVLLLGFAGLTNQARGSCGDYLVVGGIGHTMDSSEAESLDANTLPRPLRAPCHGPRCQQSPAMPLPPLPVSTGTSQHEQANVQRFADITLLAPFCHSVVEDSEPLAAGFPFRLKRPPRV